MEIRKLGKKIVVSEGTGKLFVEGWGRDGIRVTMTNDAEIDPRDFALTEPHAEKTVITASKEDYTDPWYQSAEFKKYHDIRTEWTLTNGNITAKVNGEGWLSFYNGEGKLLTEECWRDRSRISRYCTPMNQKARELRPIPGSSDYELYMRFEAYDDEKIFGMGQYQMKQFDKKGTFLELEHKNGQSSVPFYVSSRGYGFLWNNPANGSVVFAENKTEWHLKSTKKLDYWITAGTPKEIEYNYSEVTGRTPMMPEYGMGFWQCKLRYRDQEEVLNIAREYKKRGLPLDVIVVDFFHWRLQGDWSFDKRFFPDPEAMVKELKEMGVETVVSIWPTVDERSVNYRPMAEKGYLIHTDRGSALYGSGWMGPNTYYDATHPGAREYVWKQAKKNYYDKGIHIFWLDEAEPEYGGYQYDNWRYYLGPGLQVTNIYPKEYARGFYEGLKKEGRDDIMALVRCAWAGSQKYGALTWSGDIHSSFRAFKEQVQIGLSMGMAGIPWWTCDLGGFLGGDPTDDDFRELLVRWFEWGCFLPVFRLHGERAPWYKREVVIGEGGIQELSSGQPNELWSYGEENYEILKKYLFIRENLRPYVRELAKKASETGEPMIRPLFFDFPEDETAWTVSDTHMFGPDILVSPVTDAKTFSKQVYLPKGTDWVESYTGKTYKGGSFVEAEAPIDIIPVFVRKGKKIKIY